MGILSIINKNIGSNEVEKKKVLEELIILFWLFILGSVIGYIYEMIVVLVQKGYFESRQGLIYGPFTPVYGIGMIVYYLILNVIKTENKVKIFLITMLLGGITEYVCSFVQEKAFGTISWDYSYLRFNLNGRTSLLHCTYWGIAGILYEILIMPQIQNWRQFVGNKILKVMTSFVVVFMIFNITISCVAAERQTRRRKNIQPENKFDMFLDEHYPDEYMNRIFANKKDKF